MGRWESKKSNPELEQLIRKIDRKLGQPKFDSFLMSPVKEGYITYTDLISGGLTLFDIEKMNEAITYWIGVDRIVNEPKPETRIRNGSKAR